MRLTNGCLAVLLTGFAACAPGLPVAESPTAPSQPNTPSSSLTAGPGAIDANGRATGPIDVNGFAARSAPGFPNCLILNRPGSMIPYPLQTNAAFIGLGGECPSLYWRATIGSLEEFGQGIINVAGIGRCQIPRSPIAAFGTAGTCDRV